jgi:paraquat-inducible protein A
MATPPASRPPNSQRTAATAGFWLLYMLTLGALTSGLLLPALTVTELRLFDTVYSILSGLNALREAGDWLLFLLIFAFSVVLPYAKLGLLAWVWRRGRPAGNYKALELIEALGRWSLLDVLVIALAVITLRGNFFVRTQLEPGVYLFAAAALLSMTLSAWTRRLVRRAQTTPDR